MAGDGPKEFTMAEVSKNNTEAKLWLIIRDARDGNMPKVYDVTSYTDDHPGGAEVMLEQGGQDATDMFEDIGHSNDAREEMKKFYIGVLKLTEEEKAKMEAEKAKLASRAHTSSGGLNPLAVVVMLVAVAVGYYYTQMRE